MYKLHKSFKFHAAHHLPNHDGQCRNVHGHTYTVEVFVRGLELVPVGHDYPDEGMLVDFKHISFWLDKVKSMLDHTDLNDSAKQLGAYVPTAERLALGIYTYLAGMINGQRVELERVRVYETDTSWAEYQP